MEHHAYQFGLGFSVAKDKKATGCDHRPSTRATSLQDAAMQQLFDPGMELLRG